MSMRIEGQTDINVLGNVRSAENKTAGQESTTAHMSGSLMGTDNVSLSGASGWVSLAKTSIPADKQAKVAALTTQVRSGRYRADASQVSRSIVQALLNK